MNHKLPKRSVETWKLVVHHYLSYKTSTPPAAEGKHYGFWTHAILHTSCSLTFVQGSSDDVSLTRPDLTPQTVFTLQTHDQIERISGFFK